MTEFVKDCVNIFICTHQKASKKCCAAAKAEEISEYFKSTLAAKATLLDKAKKFKVVKTSCLGRCSIGPNIYITPDNIWYNYQDTSDIDKIIDQHLIANKIVTELLNKNVQQNITS